MGDGFGQDFEREGQERVTGEDGGRFVEGFVDGGTPAPEIVVIHGGQIVVDQRIAVDQFDRQRRMQGQLRRGAEHGGGLAHEKGPQPLAAIEGAVAHGRNQTIRRGARSLQAFGSQQNVERRLDLGGVGL